MLTIIITFLSAISISVIAAGYSIMGLATLFAGAVIPIIAMGSALEVGKLVAASWLYNNWRNPLVPKTIKGLSYICCYSFNIHYINGYIWFSIKSTP